MTKKCGSCATPVGRNSRHGVCRKCYIQNYYSKSENKERRRVNQLNFIHRNPKQHRERTRAWQKDNFVRARAIEDKTKAKNKFNVSENRAIRLGHSWGLSEHDFVAIREQPCSYCGIDPGKNKFGVGLDRLDNGRGYEVGNVVPCCGDCNKIRGDRLTPQEMHAAMDAVMRLRQKNRFRLVLP